VSSIPLCPVFLFFFIHSPLGPRFRGDDDKSLSWDAEILVGNGYKDRTKAKNPVRANREIGDPGNRFSFSRFRIWYKSAPLRAQLRFGFNKENVTVEIE
jgi:hypothetical protein